jgi:hypothetical protein
MPGCSHESKRLDHRLEHERSCRYNKDKVGKSRSYMYSGIIPNGGGSMEAGGGAEVAVEGMHEEGERALEKERDASKEEKESGNGDQVERSMIV